MAQFAIDELFTTGVQISGFIFDYSSRLGTPGQVLTSTSSGVMWQADSSNTDLAALSGQIIATGALLNNRINSLSGYVNDTFISGSGITNYVPRWNGAKQLVTGSIYDLGTGVGIGTTSPVSLLSIGANNSTTADKGISFGGDAQVNLYRIAEDVLRTDANLNVLGYLNVGGYIYTSAYIQVAQGNIYPGGYTSDLNLNIGNIAGNTWETAIKIKPGSYVGIGTTQPSGKLHVVSNVAGETVLRADGTNGTLFSVTDDLSDSLMSVNNSAGLPVLEVFADDRVVAGQYGSGDFVLANNKIGVGTSNPVNKLSVIGAASIGSNSYNVVAPVNGLIIEGKVGIGTTNPIESLHISSLGTAKLKITADTDNVTETEVGGIEISQDGGVTTSTFTLDDTNHLVLGVNSTTGPSIYIGTRNDGTNFVTSSDAKITILNGGNVGIGTLNPTQKLDVSGSLKIRSFGVYSDPTDNAAFLNYDTNGGIFTLSARSDAGNTYMAFRTSNAGTGSEKVRITNDGKVGIGILSPNALLSVGGVGSTSAASGLTFGGDSQANLYRISSSRIKTDGNFTIDGQGGGATSLVLNRSSTSSENGMAFNTAGVTDWYFYVDNGNNNLQIQRSSELDPRPRVRFDGANSNILFNLGGGNVGIGTDAPAGRLHVSGADGHVLFLKQGVTGSQGGVYFENADGFATSSARLYFISGDSILFTRGASNLAWSVSQDAKVGIGVSNPSEKLTVTGVVKILTREGGNFKVGDGSNTNTFLEIDYPDISTANAYFRLFRSTNTNGGKYFQIFKGDGTAGSQTLLNASGDSYINAVAGNVGVGTDNPSYKLDVIGTARANGELISDGNNARFSLFRTNGINYFDWASGQSLYFSTQTSVGGGGRSTLMTITSGGNVGINTTNPDSKLQVNGEVRIVSSASYFTHLNYLDGGSNIITSANGGSTVFRGSSNSITSMVVEGGGNVYTYYNTYLAATNGKVGINTTSPTSKLNVVETTATGTRIQLGTSSESTLMNSGSTVDLLVLNAPYGANSATTSNLGAKWGIKFVGSLEANQIDTVGKTCAIYAVSEDVFGYNRGTSLAFYTNQFNDIPYAEKMRISHNGNIGIGVTNPSNKVQISGGGISFTTSTGLAVPMIGILPTNVAYVGPYNSPADGNSPTLVLFNHAASVQQTYFYSSGRIAMVLNKEGRLNIAGNAGNTPPALLNVGPSSSVAATSGMSFGNDSSANLYRSAASTIKTDGSLEVVGNATLGPTNINGGGLGATPAGITLTGFNYAVNNGNVSQITFVEKRFATGGDWTTATTRIQKRVDVTDQAYIEFNPSGASYGMALGVGANSNVEALRILSNGLIGIGTINPTQRLEVQGNAQIGNDSVTNIGLKITRLNGGFRTSEHTYHSSQNSPWYTYGQNLTWTNELAGNVEATQAYRPYFEAFAPAVGYKIFGFMNVTAGAFTNANMVNSLVLKNDGNVGIGTITTPLKLNVSGSIYMAAGSGSAISWANDISSQYLKYDSVIDGMTLSSWNNTTFHTQQTERVRITSAGNVGIGTTSPATKLHVYGAGGGFEFGVGSSNCYIETIDRANTSAFINTSYYTRGTGYFAWYNGSYTERMRIASDGNIGIGITNPSAKLQISKNGDNGSNGFGDFGILTVSSGYATQATLGAEAIGDGYSNLNLGSNIGGVRTFWHISKRLSTASTPHSLEYFYYDGSTFNQRFTFTPGGSLGIGTVIPAGKLQVVQGDSTARYSTFNSNLGLFIKGNDNSAYNLLTLENTQTGTNYGASINFNLGYGGNANTAGTAVLGARIVAAAEQNFTSTASTQDGYLALYTTLDGASSEKVRVRSDGSVGIGTASTIGKLDVYDNTDGPLLSYVRNLNAGSNAYTAFVLRRDGGNNGIVLFTNSSTRSTDGGTGNSTIRTDYGNLLLGAGGSQHILTTAGNVGIGTTIPSSTLDVIGTVRFNSLGAAETRSAVNQGGQRIFMPSGGVKFLGNSSTGAIRIKSPVNGSTDSMTTIKGTVFEYSAGKTFEFLVSFYYYNNTFFEFTTQIIGGANASLNRNFTIRGGRDSNGAFLIYIGELTDTWAYGYVYITEVFFGWTMSQTNLNAYQTGWDISTESSAFENVTRTNTDTQITNWSRNGTSTYYNLGKVGIGIASPVTLLSVGGAGSTTAASGITFGGEAGTNIYRLSTNELKTDGSFVVSNTLLVGGGGIGLRILKDGSDSISSTLYLGNSTNTRAYNFQQNAAGTNLALWTYNSANTWQNSVNFNYNGSVGIGTTTPSGKLHVVSTIASETVLRADGTNGTLFSVVDDLSDSLMSVNNSAGLPVLEVFADDRIVAGQYGSGDLVVANNKVGIGTSNPVNKLSVIGGVNIGSNTYNVSAPTNGLIVQGDVGIGTTSAATYSSKIAVETSLTRGLMLFNPALADAGTLYGLGFGYAMSNYDSAYISFYKVGASNTLNRLSFSLWNQNDVLNILGNGNVGIGRTNPTAKLHVSGINGDEVQIGTIGSSQIVGGRSGGSFSITTKSTSNGNLILEANAAMYLRTNASNESVYIALNGNVGINTTAPVQKLQVEGVVGNPAFVGTTQSGIFRISNTTDNATLDFGIRAGGNGAWIQSTDETSLAANYSLLLNPNGGFVGLGTITPIATLEVDNSTVNVPVLNLGGGIAGNAVSDLYVLNSYNNNSGVGYAAKVIGVNISGSLTDQNIPLQRTTWGGVTSATAIALGTDGPRAGTQDNAFQIWTSNEGTAGTALTQKFSVTSAGDVGIGTVSPAYKLQVAGTAYISALLDVSSVGATSNTEGIRFGGDSEANIYRSATDTLKTDGNLVVAGGLTVAGTTTLNDNLYGSKTVNLSTSAWTTVLTISMVNHTSCYVKLGAFGDWSNHSAIAFISELFVQNGANGFNQPGTIISAYDNTAGVASDKVDIQIVDPLAAGTQNYLIQLKLISATSYSNVSTKITYHIMGQQGAVS